MAKPHVSRDSLRAMAELSGLEIADERLDELLPQVQHMVEAMAGLDALDIKSMEPAVVFRADAE